MENIFKLIMKIIFFLLAFIFCTYTNLVAQDCTIYHKGYFTYVDSVGTTILIKRRNKYQYEYDRTKKTWIQFSINWIDDCTYTITQTLTNSKEKRKFKNSVTKISISKTDGDNGYSYKCSCPNIVGDIEKPEMYIKKITREQFYKLY